MEAKKELRKHIAELNKVCKNLRFAVKETEEYCAIENHSLVKGQESTHFGAFELTVMFDEIPNEYAYAMCSIFAQGLLAGSKLLDVKAYHNFIAN